MNTQIMTATKISPISIHKLRSSNLQYKNNNTKNIKQTNNYVNNNNDIPPPPKIQTDSTVSKQKNTEP